ncbi:monooxygenase, partial [Streptomyces sp. T-3]|nr:monooxygenase [Streptomyces sp. T-3]
PHLELTSSQGDLTTTGLLRAGRGLLLDLSGSGTAVAASAGWHDRIIAVPCAGSGQQGALRGATALLVRPDGYVVWAGAAGADGLTAALTRWFGPGQPPAQPPAQS